jgi:hypothetical protein
MDSLTRYTAIYYVVARALRCPGQHPRKAAIMTIAFNILAVLALAALVGLALRPSPDEDSEEDRR